MSAIAQTIPRATLANRVGRSARDWLPAVAVFGLGIVAWQWLIPDVFGVQRFLLPQQVGPADQGVEIHPHLRGFTSRGRHEHVLEPTG